MPMVQESKLEPSHVQILEYWRGVADQHCELVEFMDWLEQNGFEIQAGPNAGPHRLDDLKPHRLASMYLRVDEKLLDDARRAVLKQAQDAADKTT